MAALRVTKKSLLRQYEDKTESLMDLAGRLPGRPTPDDIHDLRVTARRIQVMRKLLPRAVRESHESRRFDLALKSVLKSTSQLRDLDTLMDTLESHTTDLPKDLLVTLGNQRSDAAARAKSATAILTDIPAPDLDPIEIKGKRVSKRLRKRAKMRGRVAATLLDDVLGDESKIKELHALRKEVKKLRYLLELVEGGSTKISTLTKCQEALGAIHDLDVAVSYLERAQFGSKQRAILELRRARQADYFRFAHDNRETLAETLGKGRNGRESSAVKPSISAS